MPNFKIQTCWMIIIFELICKDKAKEGSGKNTEELWCEIFQVDVERRKAFPHRQIVYTTSLSTVSHYHSHLIIFFTENSCFS